MYNNIPETYRAALYDQTRRAFEFNQKMLDWQMGQIELAEKQLRSSMEMGHKALEATLQTATSWQKSMVDALAPADKS